MTVLLKSQYGRIKPTEARTANKVLPKAGLLNGFDRTFVLKIPATFAKPETVTGNFNARHTTQDN